MHEAALAENIIKIALDTAEKNHAKKISEIGLKIGDMAGVEVEALNLSFEVLTSGTPAENSKLLIEKIPIRAKCNKCGKIFTLENFNFFCPECDGILILQSGRELLVDFVDCE
ncbi:MAG: hydrogenase maturation nickel metallochaperone HypA [Selenomonadaceae bacterium]|nr:hydrogenase maturation nickel metallochaperone HypA [Selenomonadaceae bacterium]